MGDANTRAMPAQARLAILLLVMATLLGVAADSSGQTTGKRAVSTLRSITTTPMRDGVSVAIEGNGALPTPSSGVANNPPRVYLDLNDVLPGEVSLSVVPSPLVKRVRVAEHSASPLVTRVVIDLTRDSPYHVDSSACAQGRIVVIVGAGQPTAPSGAASSPARSSSSSVPSPAMQPATPLPSGARSAAPSGAQAPASPGAGRSVSVENAYAGRVSPALIRLQALRPLLETIDRQAETPPENLDAAAREFDAIAKLLAAIKPPRSRESTHALLERTCTMGARAARIRQDGTRSHDPAAPLNAASAAAGALIMLDRANTELTRGRQ